MSDQVATLYLSGKSSLQIAAMMNCSSSAILKQLHLARVKIRTSVQGLAISRLNKKKEWIEANGEKFKKLYNQGCSINEISPLSGISRSTLREYLSDMGCDIRGRGEAIRLGWKQGKRKSPKREKNPCWKGGRCLNAGGYVLINKPEHHRASVRGYVLEHILVWEKTNSRELPDGWHVHHLNGIKDDNRPENLVGLSSFEHSLVMKETARRVRILEERCQVLEDILQKKGIVYE